MSGSRGFLCVSPLPKIFSEVLRMLQVVSDYLVNIRQGEAIVLLDNFFRGCAAVESSDDQIKGHTGPSDAINATGVLGQRNLCYHSLHSQIVA